MNSHTEAAFETAIEYYLTGKDTYRKTDPAQFDRERCLDPAVVLEFIKKTQAKEWEYLKNIQKDRAETTLLEDLAKALNSRARRLPLRSPPRFQIVREALPCRIFQAGKRPQPGDAPAL